MSKNKLLKKTKNLISDQQNNLKQHPIHNTEIRRENDDDYNTSSESEISDQQNNFKRRPIHSTKIRRVNDDDYNTSSESKDSNEDSNEKNKLNVSGTASRTSYDIFILHYGKYALLLLIMLIICYFCCLDMTVTGNYSLKERLMHMKNRFQNDANGLTFRTLENALGKVVNVTKEPSAPAIFTVVVNKNAIHKSHEFLFHLVNILAPQNTVFINESKSWNSNPDAIKLKIDSEIKSNAEKKHLFVVIVDNLQNIPIDGAMIFHSYCDHELAPFKQAVFFFIVPLNVVLPEHTSSKKVDKAAFQQLRNIWSEASPDKVDSLITRITVNVINIG